MRTAPVRAALARDLKVLAKRFGHTRRTPNRCSEVSPHQNPSAESVSGQDCSGTNGQGRNQHGAAETGSSFAVSSCVVAGGNAGLARLPSASPGGLGPTRQVARSEEHTSELQSLAYLVCRLLLEKKKNQSA